MKPDSILEELWKIKDELAREARYDTHRFFETLRQWEAEHPHDGRRDSFEEAREFAICAFLCGHRILNLCDPNRKPKSQIENPHEQLPSILLNELLLLPAPGGVAGCRRLAFFRKAGSKLNP